MSSAWAALALPSIGVLRVHGRGDVRVDVSGDGGALQVTTGDAALGVVPLGRWAVIPEEASTVERSAPHGNRWRLKAGVVRPQDDPADGGDATLVNGTASDGGRRHSVEGMPCLRCAVCHGLLVNGPVATVVNMPSSSWRSLSATWICHPDPHHPMRVPASLAPPPGTVHATESALWVYDPDARLRRMDDGDDDTAVEPCLASGEWVDLAVGDDGGARETVCDVQCARCRVTVGARSGASVQLLRHAVDGAGSTLEGWMYSVLRGALARDGTQHVVLMGRLDGAAHALIVLRQWHAYARWTDLQETESPGWMRERTDAARWRRVAMVEVRDRPPNSAVLTWQRHKRRVAAVTLPEDLCTAVIETLRARQWMAGSAAEPEDVWWPSLFVADRM